LSFNTTHDQIEVQKHRRQSQNSYGLLCVYVWGVGVFVICILVFTVFCTVCTVFFVLFHLCIFLFVLFVLV
jgi:hypothetical protein